MATLDFITSNPATEAYRAAEKARQDADTSDLRLALGTNELNEKLSTQGTRLRKLEAETSTAETGAKVASDVAPYAAPKAAADLRRDQAGASSAEATAAYARPMAAAGLRSVNAAATNAEMTPVYKSLELANAGDSDGAKEIARQSGHELPDSVINSAEARSAMNEAVKQAQRLYPTNPRQQQKFIQTYIEGRAKGTVADDATGIHNVPGAPEPAETTSTFANRFEALPKSRINPDTGQPESGYAPFDRTTGQEGTFVPGAVQSRNASGAAAGPSMSKEALSQMVQSYRAGNTGVLTGVGRGVQGSANLTQFWEIMNDQLKAEGANGKDLAAAKANFTAQSAAARTAAVRSSNVDSAVEEAKNTFPLALQRSEEMSRTQFVPLNRAIQAVQAGTSSPELARFVTANQGVITAYSQAMSRTGVNTVNAQQHAEQLLSTATSQEAYRAVIEQMQQEMQAAQTAPETVKRRILEGINGRGESAASPAGSPQSSRVVGPNETITGVETAPAPIQPSPQRPNQMSPGDGTRPLPIQAPPLPPGLPRGLQYQWSPARQQYRDENGRIYDARGNLVSQ